MNSEFTIADHAKAMGKLVEYYEEILKEKDDRIAKLEAEVKLLSTAPATAPSIPTNPNPITSPSITWTSGGPGDTIKMNKLNATEANINNRVSEDGRVVGVVADGTKIRFE